MKPPPLKDDCFAMPPGVEWTPVDQALAQLRDGLLCQVTQEDKMAVECDGRILAQDAIAARSNPPYANSAVDGYGFAFDSLPQSEVISLPLTDGRSAAGAPFYGDVPQGHAIRVLTGAMLPSGVDTVVLEEDVATDGATVSIRSGLKIGANTRAAGEDVIAGSKVFSKGDRLKPQDLALLSACGVQTLRCYLPLRVGVLSTGDEVVDASGVAKAHQIYDANRPMLISMLNRWGYEAVDLGHVEDNPTSVEQALNHGSKTTDAILTTGGASAGDEDHISRTLQSKGNLQTWRIAVKPGRPLVLAKWNDVPVFGLPGNPVAALVCALIFAKPALGVLSGEGWTEPQSYTLPAAFEKNKKPGRREFLRARMTAEGRVEVFSSEGSGRISGLSWADGLVELPDEAVFVQAGDPVRYIPFGSFGL